MVLPFEGQAKVLPRIVPHKRVSHGGKDWLILNHDLHTARVMAKLGLKTVPPIVTDKSAWKGRYSPYKHQVETSAFLTLYDRAFVLSTMGTGKSMAAIWAAEYLRKQGEAKSVLVVAPLSTIKSVWRSELLTADPSLKVAVLHGSAAERKRLLAKGFDWYIINHDGIKVVADELAEHDQITHIVLDEASQFKNPSTQRWKVMRRIAKGRTLWSMTGTPMAQSPMDAYGLIMLTNPGIFNTPMTRGRWQDMTMVKVNQFKWVPKPEAKELVHRFMQPSIRHKLEDCIDLPGVVYENRDVPTSRAQQALIKKLKHDWIAKTRKGEVIEAVNAAARMSKLLQISQGVVKLEDGSVSVVDPSPRLKALCEIVSQAGSKVIVFAPFKGVLRLIEQVLDKTGYGVVRIDGSVTERHRSARLKRFREDPSVQVLVAHPKVAAHGLTLTEASTIVWYGPEHSVESYEQANARTNRPGQKCVTVVVHLIANDIERAVFQAVRAKANMQQALLKLYEEVVK